MGHARATLAAYALGADATMRALASKGHTTATDLADWLVREVGMPFREAHHVTGAAVLAADKAGKELAELTADELAIVDSRITPDALDYLSVDKSVASRMSLGGTAPARVREEAARWRAVLWGSAQ